MVRTDIIPESHAKEALSVAYVHAVIAQAGLNVKHWKWDDGIDLEIGSSKPVAGKTLPTFGLPVQIKSTQNWRRTDSYVYVKLRAKNYEQLRQHYSLCPQYLVVYLLPRARSRWICYRGECSEFHCGAYYMDLAGQPALGAAKDGATRTSITIGIPVSNRFTSRDLRRLFDSACTRLLQHCEGRNQ
ncbi:MAG: DUF4365 domain-containing protein [Phycisphaerae bacterium]